MRNQITQPVTTDDNYAFWAAALARQGSALRRELGCEPSLADLAAATGRLGEVAEHTSKRERVAMEAERDVVENNSVEVEASD